MALGRHEAIKKLEVEFCNPSIKANFIANYDLLNAEKGHRLFNEFGNRYLCHENTFAGFMSDFEKLLNGIPSETIEAVTFKNNCCANSVESFWAKLINFAIEEFVNQRGFLYQDFVCLVDGKGATSQNAICSFLSAFAHHILQGLIERSNPVIANRQTQYVASTALINTQQKIWTAKVLKKSGRYFDEVALNELIPWSAYDGLLNVAEGTRKAMPALIVVGLFAAAGVGALLNSRTSGPSSPRP